MLESGHLCFVFSGKCHRYLILQAGKRARNADLRAAASARPMSARKQRHSMVSSNFRTGCLQTASTQHAHKAPASPSQPPSESLHLDSFAFWADCRPLQVSFPALLDGWTQRELRKLPTSYCLVPGLFWQQARSVPQASWLPEHRPRRPSLLRGRELEQTQLPNSLLLASGLLNFTVQGEASLQTGGASNQKFIPDSIGQQEGSARSNSEIQRNTFVATISPCPRRGFDNSQGSTGPADSATWVVTQILNLQ